MTTLPLAAARAQLSALVDSAVATHERVEITRNGRRAAVLLSADDYDAVLETLAVLADEQLVTAHRQGLAAAASSDLIDAEQLREAMVEAGRLHP